MKTPSRTTPKTRDPVRTKGRILEKATDIFAASGFQGTSVGEIVKASRVNKRMLYHYFGDKEGIYRAVFAQQWGELKEWFDLAIKRRVDEGGAVPSDVESLMVEALGIFFDFMVAHRKFVRLMMWDGLEGGGVSRSLWNDVRGPLYAQIEFLVEQARKDGVLDRRLDPAHYIINFLGAISFYFGYGPSLADILGGDPESPAALAERRRQLQLFLKAGFLKKK